MSRFAHKTVALGTALALAMSLVGSAFAESTDPFITATTQTGSNTAIVVQTGSASSGTAVAGPGGTAKTGDVQAIAVATVSQATSQSASTAVFDGSTVSSTQAASNTVNFVQTVDAASGNALADGPHAKATSGDAKAIASANASQSVAQVADTSASQGGIAQTVQSGANTDVTIQAVLAQSGTAAAFSNGQLAIATSGDATAVATVCQEQSIDQDSDATTDGGIAVVNQSASQTINNVQDIAAVSGVAEALVEADTESPALVIAESGDVWASAHSTQTQSISQEANAFAELLESGDSPLAAVTQVADNTSIVNQFAVGFSGDAVAVLADTDEDSDGGFALVVAKTGDVWLTLKAKDLQEISQFCGQSAHGDGIADCVQVGNNDPVILQGTFDLITASSGDALATGTLLDWSFAISGDSSLWFSFWAEQFLDQNPPIL